MADYEVRELKKAIAWAIYIFAVVIVTVIIAFGLFKLGASMFDVKGQNTESLNERSIRICSEKGGTPVLENSGAAYKSCAINGKSDTRNLVR